MDRQLGTCTDPGLTRGHVKSGRGSFVFNVPKHTSSCCCPFQDLSVLSCESTSVTSGFQQSTSSVQLPGARAAYSDNSSDAPAMFESQRDTSRMLRITIRSSVLACLWVTHAVTADQAALVGAPRRVDRSTEDGRQCFWWTLDSSVARDDFEFPLVANSTRGSAKRGAADPAVSVSDTHVYHTHSISWTIRRPSFILNVQKRLRHLWVGSTVGQIPWLRK